MKLGITEPQYRLLSRLDEARDGELRLAHGRDRQVARRLGRIEAVEGGEDRSFRITNHGRNVRWNFRLYFNDLAQQTPQQSPPRAGSRAWLSAR